MSGTGDGAFAFKVSPAKEVGNVGGGYVTVWWGGEGVSLAFLYDRSCAIAPPATIDFGPSGGVRTYDIATSAICDWFVSTQNGDWLSVRRTELTKLQITVAPNASSTRVGTVTVFEPFRSPSTIAVTQTGK